MAKTHVGMFTVQTGGTYELRVHNIGRGPTSELVTVTDPLPTGLEMDSVTGAGWNCNASTATKVVCTRNDALAAGSSYPAIVLAVVIGRATVVPIHNVATVTTPDADPSNGSDTVYSLSPPAPAPTLSFAGMVLALGILLGVAASRMRRGPTPPTT
jgi:uncharacterized repeat protein (TIGR01451 family)